MTIPSTWAVADVPLICDPVPGPLGILVRSGTLTKVEVERLREAWNAYVAKAVARPATIISGYTFKPLIGERTEWPDAEFCAA